MTVPSGASRTLMGVDAKFSTRVSTLRRPHILAFKTDKNKNSTLVAPPNGQKKSLKKPISKRANKATAVPTKGDSPCITEDLDYNEAAAKLENIYKLSPAIMVEDDEKDEMLSVVRSNKRKSKRLSLEKRIAMRRRKSTTMKEEQPRSLKSRRRAGEAAYDVDKLVKEYSIAVDLVSLDWKKMKLPPFLPSSEQSWLFKQMQPMKALISVKDNLQKDLGREPTETELATATNMSLTQMRRLIEVGQAARNKLIKQNLRLVLFVINKYYQERANGQKFHDLCQAGAKGLIITIDHFEAKCCLRLSTYALFWIRHAMIRSFTVSSFMRVPFGLESVRLEIQKEKLKLLFELGRLPTEDEIIAKVGLLPERYRDVTRASKQVFSLNRRHAVRQEEFIDGIADIDGQYWMWQPEAICTSQACS